MVHANSKVHCVMYYDSSFPDSFISSEVRQHFFNAALSSDPVLGSPKYLNRIESFDDENAYVRVDGNLLLMDEYYSIRHLCFCEENNVKPNLSFFRGGFLFRMKWTAMIGRRSIILSKIE